MKRSRQPPSSEESEEERTVFMLVLRPPADEPDRVTPAARPQTTADEPDRVAPAARPQTTVDEPLRRSGSSQSGTAANKRPNRRHECAVIQYIELADGTVIPGDSAELDVTSGRGRIMWKCGASYRGEIKNGYPHGLGKKTLCTGKQTEGRFEMGGLEGKGKVIWDNVTYEGELRNALPHGIGRMVNKKTGVTYEGSFVNGKFKGKAVFTARTYTHEGEFDNNKSNGKGIRTHYGSEFSRLPKTKYVSKWESHFVGNEAQGMTRIRYPNGVSIEGNVSDGKISGYAKMTYCDGSYALGIQKDQVFTRHSSCDPSGLVRMHSSGVENILLKRDTCLSIKRAEGISVIRRRGKSPITYSGVLSVISTGSNSYMCGDFSSGERRGFGLDIVDSDAINIGLYKEGKLITPLWTD